MFDVVISPKRAFAVEEAAEKDPRGWCAGMEPLERDVQNLVSALDVQTKDDPGIMYAVPFAYRVKVRVLDTQAYDRLKAFIPPEWESDISPAMPLVWPTLGL